MKDSREDAKARMVWNVEEISAEVVDAAFHLHRDLGPGLLESVYEVVLAKQLERRGPYVERQKDVAITYDGLAFDLGFRADLLIERKVLVELKSVENLAPLHGKQVLTYLRLLNLPLGLLINFGAATFKEGVKRIVNQHQDFASSRENLKAMPAKKPEPNPGGENCGKICNSSAVGAVSNDPEIPDSSKRRESAFAINP
jgi:GxxExxY protein